MEEALAVSKRALFLLLHISLVACLSLGNPSYIGRIAPSTQLGRPNTYRVTPDFWNAMYNRAVEGFRPVYRHLPKTTIYRIETSQIRAFGYDMWPEPVDDPAKLAQFEIAAIDPERGEVVRNSVVQDYRDPRPGRSDTPGWGAVTPTGWKPETPPAAISWPPAFDMFKADELAKAAGRTGTYQFCKYEIAHYRNLRMMRTDAIPVYIFYGKGRDSWAVRLDTQEVIDTPAHSGVGNALNVTGHGNGDVLLSPGSFNSSAVILSF